MIVEYIKLFFIFFKVGLFTIGGGLAAIPLLQEEVLLREWLTNQQFADMIAVSESTPGPIGVNIATYVGYSQFGILGSIVATIGLVAPSIIIIMLVARYVLHYRDNKYVNGVFYGLRPAVTGIILAAAASIALVSLVDLSVYNGIEDFFKVFNIKEIIMFLVFLYASNKWKHHPIFYIVIAGVIGIFVF
ncbi:Chromate transport protein [Candidatus Izimaplasma bacterium HR1]|jgi:chromate transporter|uniref:chromate transporter n=1 Tax=Candidatus Izimoplasma sp. HR1 TaxID=1541959 RepID=UPI0004F7649A|nr:Chromate transport protein [Candidatus Izimaplasma bacterium HR1]